MHSDLLTMARQLSAHVSTRGDIMHRIHTAFLNTYGCREYCTPHDINELAESLIGEGDCHLVYRLGPIPTPIHCTIALRLTRSCWPSPPHGSALASDFSAFAASYDHGGRIPLPLAAVHWHGPTRIPTLRTETLSAMIVRDLTDGGTRQLHEQNEHIMLTTNGICEAVLIDPALTPTTHAGRTFLENPYCLNVHSQHALHASPSRIHEAINLKRPKTGTFP